MPKPVNFELVFAGEEDTATVLVLCGYGVPRTEAALGESIADQLTIATHFVMPRHILHRQRGGVAFTTVGNSFDLDEVYKNSSKI